MHTIRLFIRSTLMVCLITMVPAGSAAAAGSEFQHVGAPVSKADEVVSGISVILGETAPHHLRVEVCGPDGTRLGHSFPLVVEMSDTVRGVVVRNRDAGMAVGATVEGRRATVTLSRAPFMPPEPWRVVVLLSVEGNASEGYIVVGAARHPLPTPLPVGRPTVVWGTGCEESYAGQGRLPMGEHG